MESACGAGSAAQAFGPIGKAVQAMSKTGPRIVAKVRIRGWFVFMDLRRSADLAEWCVTRIVQNHGVALHGG